VTKISKKKNITVPYYICGINIVRRYLYEVINVMINKREWARILQGEPTISTINLLINARCCSFYNI